MAQKKITDLQLIAALVNGVSIPGDNGVQTYRITSQQFLAYILATGNVGLSALALDIFNGLSAETLADTDYLIGTDASDSNRTKKFLATTFVRAGYRAINNPSSSAILGTDVTVAITGTTGTVILPTAVGIAGKRFKIIHGGTNLVAYTISTTSAQTIGGVASGSYALYTNGEMLEVESDGSNWLIVGRYAQTNWSASVATTLSMTTGVKGGTTQDSFSWRRDGRDAIFKVLYQHTSAGTNATDWIKIGLPMAVDTGAIVGVNTSLPASNVNFTMSPGVLQSSVTGSLGGSAGTTGFASLFDSTNMRFIFNGNGVFGPWGSANLNLGNTTVNVSGWARAPISGWQP